MNKPSLKITYYAFQNNFGVDDFEDIERFKDELDKDYASIVKAIPIGRGGGAYQFIVDFFVNLTIEDYLKYVGETVVGKIIVDPILDSLIFTPLKKAYENLKNKNPELDCYSFTIELLDTKIHLYSIYANSIIENQENILKTLDVHFKNLVINDEFPSEIHIPVYAECIWDKTIYRPPLGMEETINTALNNNFLRLWGLKYQYSSQSFIYDVVNFQVFKEVDFMTEYELLNFTRR